jgi:hypothetical protein
LTALKCYHNNHKVITTSRDGIISKTDLRMGMSPLWQLESDQYSAPAVNQSLSLSNYDNFAVVNSRHGRLVVFNIHKRKVERVLFDEYSKMNNIVSC